MTRDATMSELIARLSGDLKPPPRLSVRSQITLLSICGAGIGMAAMLGAYGIREDIAAAVSTGSFWVKAVYAASLIFVSFISLVELARPEGRARLAFFVLPIGLLALLAAAELASTASTGWRPLIMGMSAGKCSVRIALIGLPTFLLLFWAVRRYAPTQLARAGAVIGACAGAIGALAYMLYCRETAAGFILVWYSLGISMLAGLGGIIGPLALRWR